ncbi:MAG TPA: PAS domain-containing protein [Solirubrobacterales bacterium]
MTTAQRPIELIQARSLIASLSTAAFLVDESGRLLFFNGAAGELLGMSFDQAGEMAPQEWGSRFRPREPGGRELAVEELPLTIALRDGEPGHARMEITAADGSNRQIAVSAIPIRGRSGQHGAFAIFWPAPTE